jgi:glycosyltransferase involved in cell wall biosynthesis
MSLVSVVLPTYRRAHLLPHAIRSVLGQTHRDLELIVVDDNSPDETPAVVQAFGDPRLRYVRNDPNLKLPRSLNRGFALAKGEYLTWTSDDNLFAPTAIERMVARLQGGDCAFVYADYWEFADLDDEGRPVGTAPRSLPDVLEPARGNQVGACFMYMREVYEAVGEYDPELFLVEDYDYWMRILRRFPACHIAEPLYWFRRDEHTLYCSRFCEVKAADILARVKNGLLDAEGAVSDVVALLLAEPRNLNNRLLRSTYQAVKGRSYRLTQWHRAVTERYLRRSLARPVRELVKRYQSGAVTFAAAKDALAAEMQRVATVEYF